MCTSDISVAVRFLSLLPLGRPTTAEATPLVVALGKMKLKPLIVFYPASARKLIAQRAHPVDLVRLDVAFLFFFSHKTPLHSAKSA